MEADNAAYSKHRELLNRAAGISTVKLVCHEDSWQLINGYCHRRESWRGLTQRIERHTDGMMTVTLSGRQVAIILDECASVARPKSWAVDTNKAVAQRVYDLTAAVVSQVDPNTPRRTQAPPIVVDDQVGAADSDEQTPE